MAREEEEKRRGARTRNTANANTDEMDSDRKEGGEEGAAENGIAAGREEAATSLLSLQRGTAFYCGRGCSRMDYKTYWNKGSFAGIFYSAVASCFLRWL